MMKNDMSKFVSMRKGVATCMVHHPLPADLSAVTTLYLQKKVRLAMRKTAICVMALLAGSACMAEEANRLSAAERAEGWRLLWDGTSFDGWVRADGKTPAGEGWEIKDGVLSIQARRTWVGDGKWEWKPIPGARAIILASPATIANRRSSADRTDRRLSPPFGPIPLTVISCLKRARSSRDKKP